MKQNDSDRDPIPCIALFVLVSSLFFYIVFIPHLEAVCSDKKGLGYTLPYNTEKVSETEEKDSSGAIVSSTDTQIQSKIK